MKELRFISGNKHKTREAQEILASIGMKVFSISLSIEELQTKETEKLVRDKTLKAFSIVGRPLFVEHTGLYLDILHGLPGGLTQIFWDTLQADRFVELYGNSKATAKTMIGYCDGKTINFFEGDVAGTISSEPRGDRAFQWDCVFIPEGYSETFAEMGIRKNEISMRRIALDRFAQSLKKEEDKVCKK